ncbi:MAG: sec-independent protein translocase protein TatA [Acidobacteriota bacterium]|jgi:TatA/E family protein of Tat protein translocase|nr:sec-independent protein translocase protein TatA [Acidobacteriota bacterium]
MGSLGLPEIAFIFILALLIFGPKKLPEIGRTVGKGVAEFRKATNELKRSINTELALEETPEPPQLRPRRLETEAVIDPLEQRPMETPSVELPLTAVAPPLTEPRTAATMAEATAPEVAPAESLDVPLDPHDPQA